MARWIGLTLYKAASYARVYVIWQYNLCKPGPYLAQTLACVDDILSGCNSVSCSLANLFALSCRLNIWLAGMNPFYFHAVNVVLHCLVTLVLMYTCDKAVFKDSRLAFITAVIFAVHPIHTEAVSRQDISRVSFPAL